MKNPEMSPPTRRVEVRASATSAGVRSTLHTRTLARTRVKHWTHECEERGADKGMMLAKLNVPAYSKVGPKVVMMRAARKGSKEECESDSGATFHLSMEVSRPGPTGYNDQAGMDGCHREYAGTFTEPAIHPQNSGSIWKTFYLLQNESCF